MAKSKVKPKAKTEAELSWKDLKIGCFVTEPGSSSQFRTGDWRSRRPIFDFNKCNKCTLCYFFCPEGCIARTDEGYFEADLFYCKGCGICAEECPKEAVTMVEEEQ